MISCRNFVGLLFVYKVVMINFLRVWAYILCSRKKILALESRDLSQAEKELTACKAEHIHKMTTIFTQFDNQGPF